MRLIPIEGSDADVTITIGFTGIVVVVVVVVRTAHGSPVPRCSEEQKSVVFEMWPLGQPGLAPSFLHRHNLNIDTTQDMAVVIDRCTHIDT